MSELRRRRAARAVPRVNLALEPLEERAVPSFGAPVNTPVGTDPVAVAVGDFDGDGNLDAAVVDHGAGTAAGDLRVLLGNGDGTFRSGGAYRVGVSPVAVAVADFNGDGVPDIVVASTVSPAGMGGQLAVLLGNGDGSFQPPVFTQLIGVPTALAVTDFDGDGLPDVAVTALGDGRTTGVYELLGNGDGTFRQGAHLPLGNTGKLTGVVAGDFDQDGIPDVAATVAPAGGPGLVAVWLSSDPDPVPHFYAVGVNPSSIATGFFDEFLPGANPTLDLAVANTGNNARNGSVSILYGNPDGTFRDVVNYAAGPDPTTVVVGHFRAYPVVDLAVTNPNSTTAEGSVAVLYNEGQDGFSDPEFYRAGLGPTGLAAGDFNNDSLDDLIVTNAYSNDVSVLLNEGASPLTRAVDARPGAARAGGGAEAAALAATVRATVADESPHVPAGEVTAQRHAGLVPLRTVSASLVDLEFLDADFLL